MYVCFSQLNSVFIFYISVVDVILVGGLCQGQGFDVIMGYVCPMLLYPYIK